MIIAGRHDSLGSTTLLPDGRFVDVRTEGKRLCAPPDKSGNVGVASPEFDDPWTPEQLIVQYGRGRPIVWDEPQTLMQLPMSLGCWEGCRSFVDREGHLHLFGMRFLKWPKDRELAKPDEQRTDVYHLASRDGGITWEGPQRIDFGHNFTSAVMNTVQLEGGRIVLPLEYYDYERPLGKYVSKTCYSDDGGRTWQHDSTDLPVTCGGPPSHSGAVEPVVVELNDGRVWMVIRTQLGRFYESFSDDGRVWSPPEPSRFKSSNSPGGVLRLRDGRLIFIWTNGVGPPYASDMQAIWHKYVEESWCRQVLNAAVSHDDGKTWHGYREIARLADHEPVSHRFGYPNLVELPDGDLLVTFGYNRGRGRRGDDYLYLNPDQLDEKIDHEDFTEGLIGWSQTGTTGASVTVADGEHVLRLQNTGEAPLGVVRNFPFAQRGRLAFDIKRDQASVGLDMSLDETFWAPSDRRPDPGIRVSLDETAVPPDTWVPVTITWAVDTGTASLSVAGHQHQLPISAGSLGLCYLSFHGVTADADQGATHVRRLEMAVND